MNKQQLLTDYAGAEVLVTGGAGFVGSNLVKELVKHNAHVTVLDDLFTGDLSNLKNLKIKKFIKGDVRDEALMKKIVVNFDYIFHLAARNIIVSTKNPLEDFAVNIGGTLNILNNLKRSKRLQKFIYTSSVSIYGNTRYLPINEDDSYNLLSPYAVSKLGGENYARVFYENFDLPTVVVRYSNVYGIFQSTANPYCGVVGKIIDRIHNDKRPVIHGDGEQTRDFTYIQDAVDATLLAGISDKSVGEVFNIGTGIEISINNLVKNINEIMGKDILPEYIDRRDIDNIRRRVLNIEKIRRVLRWSPQFTLRKGLSETIEWYKTI
ncbi:MAG: GDP-mannose 4,6-dehydratase [Bacteroidetes bacterium]|nr:GDP-mannose 4,6-dehydratase [Bacteroidota bacterium]